jgi:hypothetical protein
MKRMLIALASCLALAAPCLAQEARIAWEKVPAPEIVSVSLAPDRPDTVLVAFWLEIGAKGADRATVVMADAAGGTLETKLMGRSSKEIKVAEFKPPKSGAYRFSLIAARTGVAETKISEVKAFSFSLPLAAPVIQARNKGGGAMLLAWEPVREAERYAISWKEASAADPVAARAGGFLAAQGAEAIVEGLIPGARYDFVVSAIRGAESAASKPLRKLAKAEAEREWFFTWFGQSSKAELNAMEMLDPDQFVFKLKSCTFNPADGQIDQKGGKYTAFHDGISFYYTVIDPKTENFELTATFTVDYINPVADGQEGFGLLALDSLGRHGVSSANHYTNSAGVIATKFEETIDGVKKTSKDTLGARFVSGLTREIIASGDAGIAQQSASLSRAYSYDGSDLIRTGDSCRLTLKKTNTGYHAIVEKPPPARPRPRLRRIFRGARLQCHRERCFNDRERFPDGPARAKGAAAARPPRRQGGFTLDIHKSDLPLRLRLERGRQAHRQGQGPQDRDRRRPRDSLGGFPRRARARLGHQRLFPHLRARPGFPAR